MDSGIVTHDFSLSQHEFKCKEVMSALKTLPLKYVKFEDNIFIMSDQIDATIEGEPFLGLHLWFNVKTFMVISRIWGQTVACQRVASASQLIETCTAHFRGRPCIGFPDGEPELQPFLVSQSPIPRKISVTCQKFLDPDTDSAAVSCTECLKLGGPDPDVKDETAEDDLESYEYEQIMVTVEEGQELTESPREDTEKETKSLVKDVAQEMDPAKRTRRRKTAWKRYEEDYVTDEVAPPKRRKRATLWETKVKSSNIEQLNVKCEPCNQVFDTRTDYERHKEDKHDGGAMHMKCDICGNIMISTFFFRHMRSQHGIIKVAVRKCDWCPEVRSSASIRRHAMSEHFYGRFTCSICTFRGDFARELMDHMAEDHKEVGTVKCPICEQESSLKNIENHYRNCVKIKLRRSSTSDKCEQVCPTCGKTLKTKSSYRAHIRTHLPKEVRKNGEKSSADRPCCDKCGKTFKEAYLLNRHIRDHMQLTFAGFLDHFPLVTYRIT